MSATTTYDVFITHSLANSPVARELARGFEQAGLEAFHSGLLDPAADISDTIWQALAESRALVVILSPDSPLSANDLVALGAATAWNKPVFVIVNGPSPARLPAALGNYPAYPLNRLDDVIHAIRAGFEPLTDDERSVLIDIYSEIGATADELSLSPSLLARLTNRFQKLTGKRLPGERLLWELLRLRKAGRLARVHAREG
ncbi:MAG: toll/interleukin-1 receptor domain-containing protein [Planctomycetaceae bacterium]